jgi:hypothetical protein
MDLFHRDPHNQDTRNSRECLFCRQMDPNFARRRPMDRLVQTKLEDAASAHLTEEGYLRHRIAELARLRARLAPQPELRKSA